MPIRLRVRLSRQHAAEAAAAAFAEPTASMRVVGDSPTLGQWDPKRSPKLAVVSKDANASVWEGELPDSVAKAGTEFKYCLLVESKHMYCWESQGPLHRMPPAQDQHVLHHFNNGDADDSAGAALGASKASSPQAVASASSANDGLVEKRLRLLVPSAMCPVASKAASVAVVGEGPELGSWRLDAAPRLNLDESAASAAADRLFVGDIRSRSGAEFKYVLLLGGKVEPKWEANRPNRRFAVGASEDGAPPHHFDAREPHEGAGPAAGRPRSKAAAAAEEAHLAEVVEFAAGGDGADCCWIPWEHGHRGSAAGASAHPPRSIFHAFHWPFAEVRKHLKDFRDNGFDAVQLSPAQKSKHGKEWWTRYQPQDYTKIEGLGSADELRQLCADAQRHGVMIIADVVFNHMIVVAGAHEWQHAQRDPKKLTSLKRKLSEAVGPWLDAEDFQWPWFKMEGPHWDNDNRYEGWGNGEWSELRHCQKVVDLHNKHLKDLLDAGVRGIRFDAVKHMRPEHIGEYLKFLREQPFEVYAYGEVLSVDDSMHKEYMEPLSLPTTDFALTTYLNNVVLPTTTAETAAAGVRVSAERAAALDGIEVRRVSAAVSSSAGGPLRAPDTPTLAPNSVRFARNHDTVNNPGSFYGLSHTNCIDTRVVWAWLLAVHDGTVLVYPEDMLHPDSAPLLSRALKFRDRVGSKADASEVCIRYAAPKAAPAGAPAAAVSLRGPAALVAVTLRSSEGRVEGVCLLNLLRKSKLHVGAVPVRAGVGDRPVEELVAEDGSRVALQPDGQLTAGSGGAGRSLEINPRDGVFLSRAQ